MYWADCEGKKIELKSLIVSLHFHVFSVHILKPLLTPRIAFVLKLVALLSAALEHGLEKSPLLHVNESRGEGEVVLHPS